MKIKNSPKQLVKLNNIQRRTVLDQQILDKHSEKLNSSNSEFISAQSSFGQRRKSPNKLNSNQISQFGSKLIDISTISRLSKEELFNLSLEILQKPAESRTPFDIKIITMSTEHVKFFEKYGQETHETCCIHMMHLHWEGGKVLFEAGSLGTIFYIILKGSVGILVNLPKVIIDDSGKKVETKEKIPTEVKILGPGDSFGELALLDNRPRAATIKCKENCEFATLDKNNFNEILKAKELKTLFENIDFLANIKLFKGFSYGALKGVFYHCSETKFIRNQFIYKEGEESNEIYIIREGECLVSLNINDEHDINEDIKIVKKIGSHKERKKEKLDIMILAAGEIFGEEEILNRSLRTSNVICYTHSCLLYVMPKKEFYRRIYLEDLSRIYMKKNIISMKEFRQKRIKEYLKTKKIYINPIPELNRSFSKINQSIDCDESKIEKSIQKKKILDDFENEFALIEEIKLNSLEKHYEIKKKYPIKENSFDASEKIRKSFLENALSNPYLKSKVNEKLYLRDLKNKIDLKERKRQLSLFFRKQNSYEENNSSLISMDSSIFKKDFNSLIRNEANSILKLKKVFHNDNKFDEFKKKNKKTNFNYNQKLLPLKYQAKSYQKSTNFLPNIIYPTKKRFHSFHEINSVNLFVENKPFLFQN